MTRLLLPASHPKPSGLLSSTFLAVLMAVALPHPAAAADWPMFLRNEQHTPFADRAPKPPLVKKWAFKTSGPIYSSPAVYKNKVFIGSYDKSLYALDAQTGALLWSFATEGEIHSSPAAAKDVVYFGSKDHFAYALDANTGALVWKFETPGIIVTSPVVAEDAVYISSGDQYLYAINAADGKRKWRMNHYDNPRYSGIYASPAYSNGSIFSAGKNGAIYSFSAKSGGKNWSYQTGSAIYSSPAVSDGMVFVSSFDRVLYAFDEKKGALRWKKKVGAKSAYATPVIAGDRLYLVLKNGLIRIFDKHTGREAGEVTLPTGVNSTPAALGNELLLAAGRDGFIYAVNTKTKTVVWSLSLSGPIHSSPAAVDNAVYVGSEDGSLYALTP